MEKSLVPADLAVVIVHGFTSIPASVDYLAEQLAARGYSVSTPTLPGHGTRSEDLDRVSWQDWVAAVGTAVDQAKRSASKVAVVGQSLGGLLALHMAATRTDIHCVVSLAAPLWLEGVNRRVANATRPSGVLRFVSKIPKFGGPDVRDKDAKKRNLGYDHISTKGLAQLCDFMKVVDSELESIRVPVCVIHSKQDHTAPVACAMTIASAARATRLRILEHSYHLIAIDIERDEVVRECVDFFARNV